MTLTIAEAHQAVSERFRTIRLCSALVVGSLALVYAWFDGDHLSVTVRIILGLGLSAAWLTFFFVLAKIQNAAHLAVTAQAELAHTAQAAQAPRNRAERRAATRR